MKFLNFDKIKEIPKKYADGWCMADGKRVGVIHAKYGLMDSQHGEQEMSWDDSLEEICEDASKNHFLDVYERKLAIRLLRPYMAKKRRCIVCDFGASSGYMIADLKNAFPRNKFVACDLCEGGLYRSYKNNPDIMHIQMNLKKIPFRDNSVDAAVCLNVLEHIGNDKKALKEIFRVMKQRGIVCFVVPYGRSLFDYYDESIFHKRRYGKKELAGKVQEAGFQVAYENYIGTSIYPVFAMKKRWNQLLGRRMSQKEKRIAFAKDQDTAKDSKIGHFLMGAEYLLAGKVHVPFGIRNVVLAEKPVANTYNAI